MAEFRYEGVAVSGKPVQGLIYAHSLGEARRKLNELAQGRGLRIKSIQKRLPFTYKIRRPDSKKILRGEITAFTADEVRASLKRMGYEILDVRRNYFYFRARVPEKDIVVFIRLCADLLREKFPYDEILMMVGSDVENRTLRETIMEIHKDLRMGKEGHQVFLKHTNIFGKYTAHMLSIAATSGNMAEIYENTATFLDRMSDFKRNIRSVLFMPTLVLVASIAALIFYVAYIFPQIAGLLLKYKVEVPPLTAHTLAVSDFLQANFLWLMPLMALPVIAAYLFLKSENGRIFGSRLLIRLPVVGRLFYRSSMEVFARVFHALYSGSGENVEAIKIAAEACRNAYIEKKIKEGVIPIMLREGRSLSDALDVTRVFPKNAISTLRTGEETGTLRDAALRLANFYEKDTKHKMTRMVDMVNLLISFFVSILIVGITLLSTEIGFVSPPTTNFMR